MKKEDVEKALSQKANKEKARGASRYFKTGKGEYGEGDIFLGITVPEQRKVAHAHASLSLLEVCKLLKSPIHECRFTALEIMVYQFEHGNDIQKEKIFTAYLKHTRWVNNWDLVDTSASYIVGKYLFNRSRDILYTLAQSKNIWERRIAIVSTGYFISHSDFADTVKISRMLLSDTHDLIHKAVGWMLREVGKKDKKLLTTFLIKHTHLMPRTTLRYAIERFTPVERKKFLEIR